MPIPNITDIERIKNVADPVVRNLQITQCYHELSAVLAGFTSPAANWCTFATWASKQAGQTIRKEDLARLLERSLVQSPSALQASQAVAGAAGSRGGNRLLSSPETSLSARNFTSAIDRASDAVGRGNKKVFAEIGYEFARFYQACFLNQELDFQTLAGYCEELRTGDPPDGQGYLRQAFTHYARAVMEKDPQVKAELIFLANVEIGFHEQTRLQPEIAESLDAGWMNFLELARPLFRALFPANGWFHLAYLYLMRWLGRPTDLDLALQALLAEVRALLRQVITETMMTISLPSGVILRLGEDLTAGFPESLCNLSNPELCAFLEKHDLDPDSLIHSGALDWADLPDRLNYIVDLFRCYQEHPDLDDPPFSPDQVEALKAGRLPDGSL